MLHASTTSTTSTTPAVTVTPVTRTGRRERRLQSSTSSAYQKDLQLFFRFGGTLPSDAAGVMRYVELMRGKVVPSTAYRRLMAIQRAHANGGHRSPTDDPAVRAAIRMLQQGRFPAKPGSKAKSDALPSKREPRSAKPLTRALLSRIDEALLNNMLDRRDRAILLLGFAAALKRQKLAALDVRDFTWTMDAMTVAIREGQHVRTLAVPITGGELCAATAVRDLIRHLALEGNTPVFRAFNRAGEPTAERLSASFISSIVKRRLHAVGIDPTGYSAESMRRGRIQEVARGVL